MVVFDESVPIQRWRGATRSKRGYSVSLERKCTPHITGLGDVDVAVRRKKITTVKQKQKKPKPSQDESTGHRSHTT